MTNRTLDKALTLVALALESIPGTARELNRKRHEARLQKRLFDSLKNIVKKKPSKAEGEVKKEVKREKNLDYLNALQLVKSYLNKVGKKEFIVEDVCKYANQFDKNVIRGRIEYCKQAGLVKTTGKRGKNSRGKNVEILAVVEKN
jgi:hypothetical protein